MVTPRIMQGQRGSPFCGPMQLQAWISLSATPPTELFQ